MMNAANKEILISCDSLVMDVQKAFNFYYPFLKIEFANNIKDVHLLKERTLSPRRTMGDIAPLAAPIKICVDGHRTVAEIESDFSLLNMSIKVFRKSGNVWNVISLTDGWTLQNQNLAGEFISTEMAAAS